MASFRQVEDRHVSSEVTMMKWSPTMDLIALATVQGEVFLHRLTWQKVWTLPPPGGKDAEVLVNVLSWRPDGKVLAIGYHTGKVVLCDVEKANILHTFKDEIVVTSMAWVPKLEAPNSKNINKNQTIYEDLSAKFLPKPPSLSKTYGSAKQSEEDAEDLKKLKDQHQLNLLVLGTNNGKLLIFCFGIFPAGKICIELDSSINLKNKKIVSVALANELSLLTLIAECQNENGCYEYVSISYSIPLLKENYVEMQIIAQKYAEVTYLLGYLTATIKAMSEAWEDILLEIDSKLMSYAEAKFKSKSGTVSDDFLELLMFGTPSSELENFLLNQLTEKGLKKLGNSIELSYSNIQKLVLKHLQTVSQTMFYHLSDLQGMSRWEERFSKISLDEKKVTKAVMATASFLLKATEIQQVIDSSMKNFKAFFRWLYAVILRLSEEPIPAEITKTTQQDLNFVADFLMENFATEWNQEKKSTFSLERIGQYLKMEDLIFPPQSGEQNPWLNFLESNSKVKESNLIYPYYPEKSLLQQHSELLKSIEEAFHGPSNILSNSLFKKNEYVLLKTEMAQPLKLRHSHFCGLKMEYLYSAFTLEEFPAGHVFFVRQHLSLPIEADVIKVHFDKLRFNANESMEEAKAQARHLIIDLSYYSEDVLTLGLIEEGWESHEPRTVPILVQFPIRSLWNNYPAGIQKGSVVFPYDPGELCTSCSCVDGGYFVEKINSRSLENMRASSIAVSGSRKVACVLFTSRRRVRLFEMDVEDEEDETEDPIEQDDSLTNRDETTFNTSVNSLEAIDRIGVEEKENSF